MWCGPAPGRAIAHHLYVRGPNQGYFIHEEHTPLHFVDYVSASHAATLLARGANPLALPHPTPQAQSVRLGTDHEAARVVLRACEPFGEENAMLYPPRARAMAKVTQDQVAAQLANRYGSGALVKVFRCVIVPLVSERERRVVGALPGRSEHVFCIRYVSASGFTYTHVILVAALMRGWVAVKRFLQHICGV